MHPYIAGLLGIIAGITILKYRKRVKDLLGNIGWAEKYLGMGGTHTIIVLAGFLTIVFSILYMFDGLGTVMGSLFGWLIPGS